MSRAWVADSEDGLWGTRIESRTGASFSYKVGSSMSVALSALCVRHQREPFQPSDIGALIIT